MKNVFAGLMMLGLIDQVDGAFIIAKISDESGQTTEIPILASLLPCEAKEGEFFHFVYSPDVTEIRCGEPDPG